MAGMQPSPSDRAYQLVNGFRASQLVRVAAQLRIPDLLAEGPRSAHELSRATGTDADRLRRVLRGLTALGVLKQMEDGRFGNTPVGEMFRDGVAGSRRPTVMMLLPESYRSWDHVMETLRTGRTGHEIAHGGTLWDSIQRDPDFAERFNQAMASGSDQVAEFVAASHDFASASLVVDVGGGTGGLVVGVLKAHPHLRGIICDLPAGLARARTYLEQHGVLDRCTMVESNFFESVPPDADVYLLSNIIHDWDDERARLIISVCRQAARAGSRILIIERLLPSHVTEAPAHLNAAMTDLQMMVQLGSRERTVEEYRSLLEGSGWRFSGSTPGALYGIVAATAP
jgi:predicted nicotinamide N-methyase